MLHGGESEIAAVSFDFKKSIFTMGLFTNDDDTTVKVALRIPDQQHAIKLTDLAEAFANMDSVKQAAFMNHAGKTAHHWCGSDGSRQHMQWSRMNQNLDYFGWQMIDKMHEHLSDACPARIENTQTSEEYLASGAGRDIRVSIDGREAKFEMLPDGTLKIG